MERKKCSVAFFACFPVRLRSGRRPGGIQFNRRLLNHWNRVMERKARWVFCRCHLLCGRTAPHPKSSRSTCRISIHERRVSRMAITVGVYLGKKDRFLRNWYDILPRGQFPLLVKYCIQSYLKGIYFPLNTICDSDSFRERLASMKKLSPTQRNVTFTEEDGPVFKWVEEVDNGYRSEEIKTILKDTIVHTLLEEHERTPLARQRYNHLWKKPESPMYKPATEDMRIHWQGGGESPPKGREQWAAGVDAFSATRSGKRAGGGSQRVLYRWQDEAKEGPGEQKKEPAPRWVGRMV